MGRNRTKLKDILKSNRELIAAFFEFPDDLTHENISAWEDVRWDGLAEKSKKQSLASQIMAVIRGNIRDDQAQWSSKNWRFTLEKHLSPNATQAEKVLEKRFARIASAKEWANQVPACSRSGYNTRKMSIDLVHRMTPDTYEFIELKVPSKTNHVYYAAIEVLIYGIFYLLRRPSEGDMDRISGSQIQLKVLAPTEYYISGNSASMKTRLMENFIAQDLAKFAQELDAGHEEKIGLSFAYEELCHEVFGENTNSVVCGKLQSLTDAEIMGIMASRKRHVDPPVLTKADSRK